jgi:hypothetical protein
MSFCRYAQKLKRQRWENRVAVILDKEIELEYEDRLQKDLRTLRKRK